MSNTNNNLLALFNPYPENAEVIPIIGSEIFEALKEELGRTIMSVDTIQYEWNFYPFRPNSKMQTLNNLILGQIRKGIKYRIMLNQRSSGNSLPKINGNAAAILEQVGALIYRIPINQFCHAKLWIFDNQRVVLGSHNLSESSINSNIETSIIINNTKIALEYKQYFDAIIRR